MTNVSAPWVTGPPESEIHFSLRHFVLGEISGRVGRWRGTFALDTESPRRSRVDVVADATSLETGDAERDDHFRSTEFLDVRSFPEIRFRSRDVQSGADGRTYTLTGDLTIRDVTRRLTFAVSEQEENAAERPPTTRVFVGHGVVDRQDFGLHWNQDLDRGGFIVGDKVDVAIRVVLSHTAAGRFLPWQQTRKHGSMRTARHRSSAVDQRDRPSAPHDRTKRPAKTATVLAARMTRISRRTRKSRRRSLNAFSITRTPRGPADRSGP